MTFIFEMASNKKGELIILKNLPVLIENCGAKFFSEATSKIILQNLKEVEKSKGELEIISAHVV
jgi:hypothetical protein